MAEPRDTANSVRDRSQRLRRPGEVRNGMKSSSEREVVSGSPSLRIRLEEGREILVWRFLNGGQGFGPRTRWGCQRRSVGMTTASCPGLSDTANPPGARTRSAPKVSVTRKAGGRRPVVPKQVLSINERRKPGHGGSPASLARVLGEEGLRKPPGYFQARSKRMALICFFCISISRVS